MSDEAFDPYREWLGIEPHERPVDHYRLLGIERFESDAGAIEQAADERMSHVRNFQTGPRGVHTQKLLNELAAAKICLLSPTAKAKYDAALENRLAVAAFGDEPLAPPIPSPLPPPAGSPQAVSVAQPPLPPPDVAADGRPTPALAPALESLEAEATPLYTRIWFPVAAIGGVIVVAGLVWGIGRALSGAGVEDPLAEQSQTTANPLDKSSSEESPVEPDDPPDDDGVVVMQEGDGGFNFPASVATIHGTTAQLVTQDDISLVGNWTSPEDWLSWDYNVIRPGAFSVQMTYSAAESSAGARFEISARDFDKVRDVRVSDPPGTFDTDEFIILIRQSGRDRLSVKPVEMPGGELMLLKSIRFVPRGGARIP